MNGYQAAALVCSIAATLLLAVVVVLYRLWRRAATERRQLVRTVAVVRRALDAASQRNPHFPAWESELRDGHQ